jgi:hypothetical protein
MLAILTLAAVGMAIPSLILWVSDQRGATTP